MGDMDCPPIPCSGFDAELEFSFFILFVKVFLPQLLSLNLLRLHSPLELCEAFLILPLQVNCDWPLLLRTLLVLLVVSGTC